MASRHYANSNSYKLGEIHIRIRDACMNDNVTKMTSLIDNLELITFDELIILCAAYSCPKIWNFLMEKIVDINVIDKKTGQTPLHVACQYGHTKIVKIICNTRSEVEIDKFDKLGQTPLLTACFNSENIDIVKFLIDKGANINLKDLNNESPLTIACESNSDPIVSELKKNPNIIIDETNINYIKYNEWLDEVKIEYPDASPINFDN